MSGRENQLEKTRGTAIAFLEDADYLRGLVDNTTPGKAYLRRATVILRRWFVEGTLHAVAAPRVGRIHILAPDSAPFVASSEKKPFTLFASARTNVFGVHFAAAMVEPGNRPREIEGFDDPDEKISLRIDQFRKQQVIYFDGVWITRDDVIKYVANVADGVHSGKTKTDKERTIARVRHAMFFNLLERKKHPDQFKKLPDDVMRVPGMSFNDKAVSQRNLPLTYDPDSIDCVLVEILAIIRFAVESPDILNLEAEIRKEAAA